MAAPTKVWVILPVNSTTTYSNVTTLPKYTTLVAAQEACLKAAVCAGTQYMVFEAVEYAEPTIPVATVTALLLPVV